MKAKLKFDPAVIKNFFANHWEKLVVGGCVIAMLYMITTIFKRETLPANLQPQQIVARTNTAQQVVENSKFPNPPELTPMEVAGVVAPVPVTTLAEIPPFIRPETPLLDAVKRTDPTYFPVQSIQVHSDVLAMATNAGGAAAGPGFVPPAINRGPGVLRREPVAPKGPGAATNGPLRGDRTRQTRPTTPATQPNGLLAGKQPGAADADANPNNEMQVPAGFVIPGAPGTGSAEVRPFNIITAVIPVEMQQKEYERKFSHARHANVEADVRGRAIQQDNSDVPQYMWWRLERTDLTDGSQKTVVDYGDVERVLDDRKPENVGADLVMRTLKPTKTFMKLRTDLGEWGGTGAEVVPSEYLAEAWLSWPLPPMLLHDWGREATNPKIPLVAPKASETPADGTTPANSATEPDKSKPADNADPFAKAAGGDAATSPSPAPSPRGGMNSQPFMSGQGRGGPYDARTRSGRGSRFDRSARGGQNFAGPQFQQNPDAPQVPYKLFRFTDFDVEPGHTYQYRLQLVLRNPNFGQPPELLDKPQPKPLPYADTPWSELSAPTTVPVLTKVVLESIERPRKSDPKAKAGVLGWFTKKSSESGNEANLLLAKSDLNLGDVANFIQKKILAVIDPSTRNIHDFTADLISNAALVDVHGGDEKLPAGEKASPDAGGTGELLVLVVGRNGAPDQLTVVNQAVAKMDIDAWTKTHIVPKELLDAENDTVPGRAGPVGRENPATTGGLLGPRNPSGSRSTAPTRAPGVGR